MSGPCAKPPKGEGNSQALLACHVHGQSGFSQPQSSQRYKDTGAGLWEPVGGTSKCSGDLGGATAAFAIPCKNYGTFWKVSVIIAFILKDGRNKI